MYKKSVLLALIAVFLLTGCGYKLALSGKEADFTIFSESIYNNSGDIEATQLFRDTVIFYLTSINTLKSRDEAEYIGEFTLSKFDSSGTSDSSRTTTAYVNIIVDVVIKDKSGNITMKRNFGRAENYDNTASLSETAKNRDEAFRRAVSKIMTDFRNVFEQR